MTSQAWVEVEDAELSAKLLDIKSLMHLRRGAFEEAVTKAYEAMTDAEVRRAGPISDTLQAAALVQLEQHNLSAFSPPRHLR